MPSGEPPAELRLYGPEPREVRRVLAEAGPAVNARVGEDPDGVVVVRVAPGPGGDAADERTAVHARLAGRWPDAIVSTQGESLAAVVVALLEAADLRLAAAESLTGGLVAHAVSEVPGAGSRFPGGVVAYTPDAKRTVLDVPAGPVVSEQAARAMARGSARLFGVGAAVAVTGVAGPAEQDGRPVGTVFAASALDGDVRCVHARVPGDRPEVQQRAVGVALDLLRRHLLDAARASLGAGPSGAGGVGAVGRGTGRQLG
jgi:PncC family amidohydrolase